MVIRVDIEIWVVGKVLLIRGCGKSGTLVGEVVWVLLGFVALVHVCVFLLL
jgi:hypothetical protein